MVGPEGDGELAFAMRELVVTLKEQHADLAGRLEDIAARLNDGLVQQEIQYEKLCNRFVSGVRTDPTVFSPKSDSRNDTPQLRKRPVFLNADSVADGMDSVDVYQSTKGAMRPTIVNNESTEDRKDSAEPQVQMLQTERRAQYRVQLPSMDSLSIGTEPQVSPLEKFVMSHTFNWICGGPIILFSVLLGFETDFMAHHDNQSEPWFATFHMVFGIWFAIELAVRIVGVRTHFCTGEERWWNLVDTLMVLSWLFEVVLVIAPAMLGSGSELSSPDVLRVSKVLRVLRLVKMLRIIRVMRSLQDFQKMVYALQGCVMTLGWCVVLIFGIIYIFALLFTQGAVDFLRDSSVEEEVTIQLRQFFGTLPRSLFSLFSAMSNGIGWEVVVLPWVHVHWVYTLLFLLYITFSMFGLLNVLASVFVESTMRSAAHHRDLLISDARDRKEAAIEHLRTLFAHMDTDGTGEVDIVELKRCLEEDGDCVGYLQACEISISDVEMLFRLIDTDLSGTISLSEFCEGCLRLKGEARSYDVHVLMFDIKRCMRAWTTFTHGVSHELQRISVLTNTMLDTVEDNNASVMVNTQKIAKLTDRMRTSLDSFHNETREVASRAASLTIDM
eukprot:TRINITY_DN36866_c0_g1_i1.p1 TRINITY_DN36866_c0_g1~~TRINITY_DN36866_c0_g1_i1.p1  ORF type:complete len:612 (+),score=73.78 TRINITY_DN36866_c0_g1_i1:51-1886(+)